nr:retrovirus-related Pol polyprotein from transposon TNT 1-94 [Tanacetum cinerariifolium]
MVVVLQLQAFPFKMTLSSAFKASSFLTCLGAPLVVSGIGICRTPTVTGQMANSVALLAFRSTSTIMVIVAFRAQWLISSIWLLLPRPRSTSFYSQSDVQQKLYCRGKENGVNILKSIDEGPFHMGTVREPLGKGTEGAPHLGETIHDYYVRFAKLINDMRNIKMTMSRMQLNSKFVNNMLPEWGRFVTAHYLQSSSTLPFAYVPPHLAENAHLDSGLSPTNNLIENLTNTLALLTQSYKTFPPQTNNQLRTSSNTRNQATVQDGRVVVQNVHGRQNRGQGTNPREAPMAQTMIMAHLSSADPVYDEAGPSYDSEILSKVHDHDHYQDDVCEHHEEHAMHDNVQLNHVVDSHADYTSDSNMIMYDQYVKDNAVPEREQKINEQLRIVITDCNFEKETLKKELHSVKLQLASIINHNKLMVEEVTSLKNDFKQKENKYLEDFLDMKSLKEKVEDRLFKQDQSLQTVHMLRRPKPYYNELNKVKIAPHDYSKENFLATFTPQKQLTPEQIFWSQDLIKMKTEALKEQTKASRPIKALMLYPPNTPATLVHRVLPMKSQEHFEGIQKALTKEIKEMKKVFEELEVEVAQNVVDRKHDEIEGKNLLIANDNLIDECLSKEVFYVATNSELNVARFNKMHVANNIVEARCLELEAELSTLRDKSHNDNHNELVNRFSNLEGLRSQITQLTKKVIVLQAQNDLFTAKNEKIKQHYKELYDSIKITRAKHIEQGTALTTENVNLKGQILNMVNSVGKDHVKPIVLAPGVNRYTNASRSQPKSNTKKNRISPAKDYVIGDSVISKVYYVEGVGHNLFFVKQFCDSDLEVAFKKHSCYVRDTNGVELIKGSRGSNLYTISVEDIMKSSLVCFLSKASKNKSWLWHRHLNHLNFGTINDLAKKDLVRGLPKLKFKKDHLHSACQLGKSKKHTHKPKTENTNLEVLNTLHMDLRRPM